MGEKFLCSKRVDAQPHTDHQFRNNACDGFQDDIQRLYLIIKREHF
jgi:hypothetical protein